MAVSGVLLAHIWLASAHGNEIPWGVIGGTVALALVLIVPHEGLHWIAGKLVRAPAVSFTSVPVEGLPFRLALPAVNIGTVDGWRFAIYALAPAFVLLTAGAITLTVFGAGKVPSLSAALFANGGIGSASDVPQGFRALFCYRTRRLTGLPHKTGFSVSPCGTAALHAKQQQADTGADASDRV